MEGSKSFFVLVLLSTFTTSVLCTNCYGGSIVQTNVLGGTNDDEYTDAIFSNNDLLAVGYIYSWDFPYDQLYASSASVFPTDALLTISSTVNTSEVFSIVTGSYGNDYTYSVDADGDYVCVAGTTDNSNSFPSNTDFSYYGYQFGSAFLVTFNKTTNPPTRILSELVGDIYEVDRAYVTCSAKHQVAFVVSTSGYYNNYKRGDNDYDVRITAVDLNDGHWLSDSYFGGVGQDDNVHATEFFERGTDKFLMIAGRTYSTGDNDSFPLMNAFQSNNTGGADLFVWMAKVNNYTITWQFATFLGGYGYESILDVKVDESGNTYVLVGSTSPDFPMKNAWDTEFCGNIEQECVALAVFNLQGELLVSSWMGTLFGSAIDVQRLADGGHLLYLVSSTYQLDMNTMEGYQYNITNATQNFQDIYTTVYYIDPKFSSATVRFQSYFGGSYYDYATDITVLPNNRFAVTGYSASLDLPAAANYTDLGSSSNVFTTIFECGSGLYVTNPSPTPVANQPTPSPPASTCGSSDGCYNDVPGIWVQFESGDDGEYVPSQTMYPATDTDIETDYWLAVNYLSLEENKPNGDIVVSIPFPTSGYTLEAEDQVINGVNVNVVTFSAWLSNGAQVDVIHYFFEQSGTMDFAGATIAVGASTTKVSLKIYGWNFENPDNTLTLTILLDISPEPQGPATSVPSGNQTQFSWDTGATDCIVTTVSVIEIDDGVGTANNSVTAAKIQVTFPSFTDYVLYDPGYAVLVKEDKKSSPKEDVSPWAYVGAALGAVVVVSAAVGIGYFIMSRQKRRTEKALSFKGKEDVEMK